MYYNTIRFGKPSSIFSIKTRLWCKIVSMKERRKWLLRTAMCSAVGIFLVSACGRETNTNFLDDVIYRENYTSVYEKIGTRVSVDMLREDANGLVYATVDGVEYELGMDFLSMAMVYNTAPVGEFTTPKAVYNEWWRLFMQRWNYLAPEAPLYSNQYYDVYNAKIDKLQTSPYWQVADAIVGAKVTRGDNAVALGSITELSGAFRVSSFGKSAPGGADLDVEKLTSGYTTVVTDEKGAFLWADSHILPTHTQTENEDGTTTFTMRIADNLTFSNGAPITAENYLVSVAVGSTPVMREAGGGDGAGLYYTGYETFKGYDGQGEEIAFSGLRMLDKQTFSVTVKQEYANYYYAMRYAELTPVDTALYLGDLHLQDDGNGVYIPKSFYEKTQKNGVTSHVKADDIVKNVNNTDATAFPYSGPDYVERYDKGERTALLKRNERYLGDHRGKPSIDRISYVKIVPQTQIDQLQQGRVDILSSITGGEETRSALAVVDGVRFKETHYDRAGYGKLAFRCDFGPTQFEEVRRAVLYTIDRNEFAQTFTGGYGSVVDAPYFVGSDAYLAVKDKLRLNSYAYSVESAKAELVKGGFVYNADGSTYDENKGGIRYKKLTGYEKSYNNLAFASTDGKYKTVKVDGEYYMPLVINWMGTQPNPVTDQLITAWQTNPNAGEKIGAYITYTTGDMNSAIYGEYCQMPAYGFTKARFGAVNFATGFTSAVYDQSFYWTIDPERYDNYSSNFLMDEADFYSNYR